MSKRKDKENLPNDNNSKKSKTERSSRTKIQSVSPQDAYFQKILTKIDSEPLTTSHLTEM